MSKKKRNILIILISFVAIAIVGIILFFALSAKGPYSGKVTDAGTGEPLANVSVSDGRNVVKTDAEGKFSLEGYRKSRFVMVSVPAGYATDDFYIPVEKNKEAYLFSLEKSEATKNTAHSFLQISDTEIKESVGDWINNVKDIIKETKPAFLMHTGDICYKEGLKQHIKDMNTQNMGCTVRYAIGNHDYVEGKYGEALYESLYGPVWYSFDVGNVHYVVTPFQNGADERSGYNKNDRWRWLENDLANTNDDKTVVMINHTKAPSEDYVISFDKKELDLKKHNIAAWVFGHYHYNYVKDNNGVLDICTGRPDCGGIDQSASGVREIIVDANGKVSTKMHYVDITKAKEPQNAVWSTQLKGNVLYSDTLLEGDKVFVATVDDDYPRECGVYALNAKDGKILWSYETGNSVKNKLVYNNGKIYAQDCDGMVYCLDANTGKLNWQKQTELESLSTSIGLCINGDLLFAGSARNVSALNVNTGEVVWTYARSRGEESATEFIVAGNKLIVGSHWDALVAVDKTTGKKLWENDDKTLRFRSSTPIVLNEKELLVADSSAIMIVNLENGKIISKTEVEEYVFSSSAQPLILDNIAYIATAKNGFIAFDLSSKTVKWVAEVKPAIVYTAPYVGKEAQTVESSPVLLGEDIMFGASDGYIYVVNRDTGEIKQTYQTGAPVLGSVAIYEDTIIASDFMGRVSAFKKK